MPPCGRRTPHAEPARQGATREGQDPRATDAAPAAAVRASALLRWAVGPVRGSRGRPGRRAGDRGGAGVTVDAGVVGAGEVGVAVYCSGARDRSGARRPPADCSTTLACCSATAASTYPAACCPTCVSWWASSPRGTRGGQRTGRQRQHHRGAARRREPTDRPEGGSGCLATFQVHGGQGQPGATLDVEDRLLEHPLLTGGQGLAAAPSCCAWTPSVVRGGRRGCWAPSARAGSRPGTDRAPQRPRRTQGRGRRWRARGRYGRRGQVPTGQPGGPRQGRALDGSAARSRRPAERRTPATGGSRAGDVTPADADPQQRTPDLQTWHLDVCQLQTKDVQTWHPQSWDPETRHRRE